MDATQPGDDATAVDLDHGDDRNLALSSDDNGAIARRLRPQRADADVPTHQPLWQTTQRAPTKRKKRRAFLDGRRRGPRVANRPVSRVAVVDPVEDELLLDCVLAIRPHAQREFSQRANGWQAVAAELKRLGATRLRQYSGSGLRMRVAFLLRAFQDSLHQKHDDVRGDLRAKLAEYCGSLQPQQAPRRLRVAHATAQDTVAHQGDDNSDSDDFELINTSARRASRWSAPPASPQAQSTPRPQPSSRRHARALNLSCLLHRRRCSQIYCSRPQRRGVSTTTWAFYWRVKQTPCWSRTSACWVLQCLLKQNQASIDDQREWRACCLSLLVPPPPPRAANDAEFSVGEC